MALDAPCLYNSRLADLPSDFFHSAAHFATRWKNQLPVATPCALIDRDGRVRPG